MTEMDKPEIIYNKFIQEINFCVNFWKDEYKNAMDIVYNEPKPKLEWEKHNDRVMKRYLSFTEYAWKHHSEVLMIMMVDFPDKFKGISKKYALNSDEKSAMLIGFIRILKQEKVLVKIRGRTYMTDITKHMDEYSPSIIGDILPVWIDKFFAKQEKKINRKLNQKSGEELRRIKEANKFKRFLNKTEAISSKDLSDNRLGFNL